MVKQLNTEGVAVTVACDTLAVSRSGYYGWLIRPESQRAQENAALLARIEAIYNESKQTYGSPRITAALQSQGVVCSEKRVARIMAENQLVPETRKKFKITTTDSNHDLPIAERIFETENVEAVMAPNQVWTSDITYIPTEEGWLFLAVFLDIFTRKVVGFSADDNMRVDLVINALNMALGRQFINKNELIAHSDRGSQFAAEDYRKKLVAAGIIASMSRKGNCYDNAHIESFFHSLKTELVYRKKFRTREEAKQAIFEWIEIWYNRQRLHSALNYMSPVRYEEMVRAA
jgi:putative transposase